MIRLKLRAGFLSPSNKSKINWRQSGHIQREGLGPSGVCLCLFSKVKCRCFVFLTRLHVLPRFPSVMVKAIQVIPSVAKDSLALVVRVL